MSNPRDQWLPIRDPELLSRLLREVIDEKFGGSRRRTAFHLCGIPWPGTDLSDEARRAIDAARAEIRRLEERGRGERNPDEAPPRVSLRNVGLIAELLDEDKVEEFKELFFPDGVVESILCYEDWVGPKLRASPVVKVPMGEFTDSLSDMATSVLKDHALRSLRSQFPELFQRLDEALVKGGHTRARARLALDRIVEPLLDHIRTGGIERGLDELGDDELRRYVRLTIEREEILLRRAPDWERGHDAQVLIDEARAARVHAVTAIVDPRALMPGLDDSDSARQ